jgi:hypothetical protein
MPDRTIRTTRAPRWGAAPLDLDRRLDALAGARPAKLPYKVEPQLALLVDRTPEGDAWLHEIKFDGYRLAARLERGKVSLLTRGGHDWTVKFPAVAAALMQLPVDTAYLDGEACHVREDGVTSFSGLQDDLGTGRIDRVFYFVFDLLHLDGRDLTSVPPEARKALLATLLDRAVSRTAKFPARRRSIHTWGSPILLRGKRPGNRLHRGARRGFASTWSWSGRRSQRSRLRSRGSSPCTGWRTGSLEGWPPHGVGVTQCRRYVRVGAQLGARAASSAGA